MYEIEIVGRRMVLRKCPPDTAHQAANRKIKTGRAILPFIVSVGGEVKNLRRFVAVPENVSHCPIDLSVASSAFLVMESPSISNACQH